MKHGLSLQAMDEAIMSAMRDIEPVIHESMQHHAPHGLTGNFAMGIATRFINDPEGPIIEVYDTAEKPLLEWVIEGTMPHEIGAEGQFLYNPEEEFAAIGPVMHPGTQPNDFAERAFMEVQNEIEEIIIESIEREFALL